MEFEVGGRCQWQDRDESDQVYGGTVDSIIPPKTPKPDRWWGFSEQEQQDFITYAVVKWDDGSTDTVDMDDLDEEDDELQREFRTIANKAMDEIGEKLAAAEAALSEACDLAEKYGVPFHTGISFLSQTYTPTTYSDKFGDLDSGFVDSIAGASASPYEGWEHSAVC